MKTIDFLANPSSPHVRHWNMVLQQCGMRVTVHGIPQHFGSNILVNQARTVGPQWFSHLPRPLAYTLAGVWLRWLGFLGKPLASFIHAHNTSGYGLMAWLSGIPYCVTTYGSEIYTAPHKSFLYRLMIRSVLSNAKRITSSSPQMTDSLVQQLKIPREKIQEIYLGVAPIFLFSENAREQGRKILGIPREAKVWIANRRMLPIYQTIELVRAFNHFAREVSNVHLILIEGDADKEYGQQVRQAAEGITGYTHIIQGFVTQDVLARWLCTADFAVSIPKSDQLSSSILEAMRCEAIPVLGKLPAYQKIGNAAEWIDLDPYHLHSNLLAMFRSTFNLSDKALQDKRFIGKKVIDDLNRKDVLSNAIHELYHRFV